MKRSVIAAVVLLALAIIAAVLLGPCVLTEAPATSEEPVEPAAAEDLAPRVDVSDAETSTDRIESR